MYYIVLTREDSAGPIFQQVFETYKEAKQVFEKHKEIYFFCKLCVVIEEGR